MVCPDFAVALALTPSAQPLHAVLWYYLIQRRAV